MKHLLTLTFAAAMLTAPAWLATPAQAMTMEECLANHSKGYCDTALGTASIGNGSDGYYSDYEEDQCSLAITTETFAAATC
jgi:hypothetical protein